MNTSFWTHFLNKSTDILFEFGPKIIYAIIVLVIGIILVKLILRAIKRILKKSRAETSLKMFIISMSIVVLYAILVYAVGRTLGIKASAFLTVFGAAGLAIGLALQGSLANFAGGLLILIFKPFRIGDEVIIDGVQGVVYDINVLYTRVSDWRGEIYTMPNGKVSNEVVRNNSAEAYRRVQIELHFSFDENVDRLREIITTAMKKNPQAAQDHPFQLWLNSFDKYSLKMSARCWSKTEEYWDVYWGQIELIKKALDENHIKMTLPSQNIYQPDLQAKSKLTDSIHKIPS